MNQTLIVLTIQMIVAPFVVMTIYGFTKAFISSKLGDPLPKRDRRITLNPLKHIEVIGFLLFIVTGVFGWSRPVETSNLYYKNRKRDILITNLTPIILLMVLALGFRVLFLTSRLNVAPYFEVTDIDFIVGVLYRQIASFSMILAVVNLIPITPFDGGKILLLYLNPNQTVSLASKERAILFIVTFMMIIWPANPLTMLLELISTNLLSIARLLI